MGPTLWLNPEYRVHPDVEGQDKVLDYEGCFSVDGVAGLVPRYYKIIYNGKSSIQFFPFFLLISLSLLLAFTAEGEAIEGVAEGFLARIIQHEIDHLNGVLFTDLAQQVIPMEEYREMRKKAREEVEAQLAQQAQAEIKAE